MKAITHEWLERAADDLQAAELLLVHESLTNMSAFHAQQVVEKSFKAMLEEPEVKLIRTHSLTRLYQLVKRVYDFIPPEEMDMLDRLEAVYTESRYPSELGLLPFGKPTSAQADSFVAFARKLHEQIYVYLASHDTINEDDTI